MQLAGWNRYTRRLLLIMIKTMPIPTKRSKHGLQCGKPNDALERDLPCLGSPYGWASAAQVSIELAYALLHSLQLISGMEMAHGLGPDASITFSFVCVVWGTVSPPVG